MTMIHSILKHYQRLDEHMEFTLGVLDDRVHVHGRSQGSPRMQSVANLRLLLVEERAAMPLFGFWIGSTNGNAIKSAKSCAERLVRSTAIGDGGIVGSSRLWS
mmetsp:Transcript_4796/g.10577  ORF Transcript_4796/g.10577 Transcript_4796/m.10577 type:complete len:103 (-) Transcript_4796:418-726(-)